MRWGDAAAAAWPVQSFLKHFRPGLSDMIEHNGRSMQEGATHLDGRPAVAKLRHMEDDTAVALISNQRRRAEGLQGVGPDAIMQVTDPADIYIPRFSSYSTRS